MMRLKKINVPDSFSVIHYAENLLDVLTPAARWERALQSVLHSSQATPGPLLAVPKTGVCIDSLALCDGPVFALSAKKDAGRDLLLWIDKPGYGQYELNSSARQNPHSAEQPLPLAAIGTSAASLQSPLLSLKYAWKESTAPARATVLFTSDTFKIEEIVSLYVLRMLYLESRASIYFSPKIQASTTWPGIKRFCENIGLLVCQDHTPKKDSVTINLQEHSKKLLGLNLENLIKDIQKPSEVIPGMLLKNILA